MYQKTDSTEHRGKWKEISYPGKELNTKPWTVQKTLVL